MTAPPQGGIGAGGSAQVRLELHRHCFEDLANRGHGTGLRPHRRRKSGARATRGEHDKVRFKVGWREAGGLMGEVFVEADREVGGVGPVGATLPSSFRIGASKTIVKLE